MLKYGIILLKKDQVTVYVHVMYIYSPLGLMRLPHIGRKAKPTRR